MFSSFKQTPDRSVKPDSRLPPRWPDLEGRSTIPRAAIHRSDPGSERMAGIGSGRPGAAPSPPRSLTASEPESPDPIGVNPKIETRS